VYFQDEAGQVFHNENINAWVLKLAYDIDGQQLGVFDNDNTFHIIEDYVFDNSKSVKVPSSVRSFDWLGIDNTVNGQGLIESIRAQDGSYPLVEQATIQANEQLSAQELDKKNISLARWAPDGEMLAYTQDNQLLVKHSDELHRIIMEGNQILDLSWHPGLSSILPNTNFFATTDKDSTLAIWDALTLSLEQSINLPAKGSIVRWTSTGDGLVVGDENGNIAFYDKHLQLLNKYSVHQDQINDLAWSPDSRHLAITAEDKTAIVWDVTRAREKARLQGHTDWLRQVVWLNNEELATCGDDQQINIWSWSRAKNTYSITQQLDTLRGAHYGLDVDKNSRLTTLVAGTYNGELGIWQRSEGPQAVFELNSKVDYQSDFTELNWHPKGKKLLFSSYAAVPEFINFRLNVMPTFQVDTLNFFDRAETRRERKQYATLIHHFYLPEITINSQQQHLIQWSSEERFLAFAKQKKIEIHDFEEEELVYSFMSTHPIDFLTFSPDQSYLAVADLNHKLSIWPTNNWTDPSHISLGDIDIQYWTWSADSRYLAMLSSDFQLYLYDLSTNRLLERDLQIEEIAGQGTLLFHPRNNNLIYVAICSECSPTKSSLLTKGSYLYEIDWKELAVKKRTILPKSTPQEESNYIDKYGIQMHWADEEGNRLIIHPLNERIYTLDLGEQPAIIQEFGSPNTISGAFNELVYEYVPMPLDVSTYKSTEREYLKFWNPDNGQLERKLLGVRQQRAKHLSISPKAGLIAALGSPLESITKGYKISETAPLALNIWELEGQREIVSLPVEGATRADFSPNGKYVLLFFENGRIAVWPHDISLVARYIKQADKDYVFTQESNSRQSSKNKIEDWSLELGLNVALADNLDRIIAREAKQTRVGWSAFFLEQAWLANDNTVAEAYFNKAKYLHIRKNGAIRASRQDTLAVAATLLDQAFFYLAKSDLRTARNHLRTAQRKLPNEELLQQGSVLLSWQKGEKEAVFKQLMQQDNTALQQVYSRFKENDLSLQDNLFFERILATLDDNLDPGLNKVNPRSMRSLLANFDPTLTRPFLERYYYINRYNEEITDRQFQLLLTDALDFFDDENTPTEPQDRLSYLTTIVILSNNLIPLLIDTKQYDTALTYASRNAEVSKDLLKTDVRDRTYVNNYFYSIRTRGLLMAINQPEKRRPIYQMIAQAEATAKVKNDLKMQLLRGHLALLEQDKDKAYNIYFELLNSFEDNYDATLNYTDVINQDVALLNIDSKLASNLRTQLSLYKKYQSNLNDLRYASQQRTYSPYLEDELLSDVLDNLFTKSQLVIIDGKNLFRNNYLPAANFQEQVAEFNNIGSELAWYHLEQNNFEQAAELLETAKKTLPEARWPNAIEAVVLSTQEEKRIDEIRNILFVCKTQRNDGFKAAEYPTLKQRLRIDNLPENIRRHPVFIKNQVIWEEVIGN
ncbi:MAG: hypothetical protein AAGJ93_00905, partial [Bacteroidota bacterium]